VLDRKVSVEQARTAYGVVLAPSGAAVDHDATKTCRDELRRAHGVIDWTFDRGGDRDREP
jgi:hypothetical protein